MSVEVMATLGIIGDSPEIRAVLDLTQRICDKAVTVLVTGETGTGKELVARALHTLSPRGKHPFVAVNCGAIPGTLLESELFGHERGAFTGASESRSGKLEMAHGGSLFLDEIGDMPVRLQGKLLRVLETRRLTRLGTNKEIPLDVRVISATNTLLSERIKEGQFREDLYYRLKVATIEIPPLRERASDIPLLIHHFLEHFCREQSTPLKSFSPKAMKYLCGQEWPGNVRELKNFIEFAVTISGANSQLTEQHFPGALLASQKLTEAPLPFGDELSLPEGGLDLAAAMDEIQRRLILQSLEMTEGNREKAARLLSVSRSTLHAKIKKLGLN